MVLLVFWNKPATKPKLGLLKSFWKAKEAYSQAWFLNSILLKTQGLSNPKLGLGFIICMATQPCLLNLMIRIEQYPLLAYVLVTLELQFMPLKHRSNELTSVRKVGPTISVLFPHTSRHFLFFITNFTKGPTTIQAPSYKDTSCIQEPTNNNQLRVHNVRIYIIRIKVLKS